MLLYIEITHPAPINSPSPAILKVFKFLLHIFYFQGSNFSVLLKLIAMKSNTKQLQPLPQTLIFLNTLSAVSHHSCWEIYISFVCRVLMFPKKWVDVSVTVTSILISNTTLRENCVVRFLITGRKFQCKLPQGLSYLTVPRIFSHAYMFYFCLRCMLLQLRLSYRLRTAAFHQACLGYMYNL